MHLTTKKKYAFFEVSSAFQKSVRRGEEAEAMYWAVELFNSGFDEYLWKRILVITSEDIGLAEPNAPAVIGGLYQNYVALKKKSTEKKMPHKLPTIHAVLYLCRAKKSRLVDWALIAAFKEHDTYRREIPDYAHDKHTTKGKRMGRGNEHFFKEGTELSNHILLEGEKEAKKRAWKILENQPASLFPEEDTNPF